MPSLKIASFALIFLVLISVLFVPHQVIAPRIPGLLERIQQPLYDQNTVATAGTPQLNYFQVPLGSNSISVKYDPAGHSQYIRLQLSQLTLVTSADEVAIVAPSPWVNMSGTISDNGIFTMSGQGTVAGYPNILSTMSGTFQNNNLDGDLIMGGDGKLPSGQSITYHVTGTAQPETLPQSNTGTTKTSKQPTNQNTLNFVIPSWIKNNAKWWSEGQIGDSDMIKGLQYLISNGIIVIPATTYSGGSSQQIPSWIKNNAKWWSEGQIDDSEFVKGIQFMISNGIISVQPKETIQSKALFNISQTKIQTSVEGNSFATISGKIQDYNRGDPVTITITKPDHTSDQLSIYAAQSGYFTTPLEFDKNSMQGTYSVTVTYGTQNLGTILVNVGNAVSSDHTQQTTTIPTQPRAIGCAGGQGTASSHDYTWWSGQKNQFTTIEGNLTILKQPTNTACGPTVGTIDLMHWNSTIAPGIVMGTPEQMIQRLMGFMHYKDGWGTTNMTIAAGLSDYINSTGYGGKLKVSVYGKEYENGTANTGTGTVSLVHSDVIDPVILHAAMVQKSNVLVIIQSPDGTRSHIMKLLAINDTKRSDDYYKVAFIDTQSGGIITELMGDDGTVGFEDKVWTIVNIITVTPTVPK